MGITVWLHSSCIYLFSLRNLRRKISRCIWLYHILLLWYLIEWWSLRLYGGVAITGSSASSTALPAASCGAAAGYP